MAAARPIATFTSDDYLLLVINVVGLVWAGISAWFDLGPWAAWACTLLTSVLYLVHVQWRGHDILKNLLLFGLAGGLAELAADWWLVSLTRTLHYAPWGPFLIDSPAYMPGSWAGILLSMGFLGCAVRQRWGTMAGVVVATAVTGIYVPTFEALAHAAGWWTYSNCRMLGVVPWYIIVGEALVGLSLTPLVALVLVRQQVLAWVGAGVVAGLWIWASYFIALSITG